jgi:hypothetical protein
MRELQWDEYRKNAQLFVLDYLEVKDEKGEAHSFWDRFFEIFGLQRIRFASHEARVKREGNKQGYIDLLWSGKLLVEHKSATKDKAADFEDALTQSLGYIDGLKKEDQPQKLILCNFKRFRIYDLNNMDIFDEIRLEDLPKCLEKFDFFIKFAQISYKEEEDLNIKAVERITNVYRTFKSHKYLGHDLELLLVRTLFCLFAEDTGIFKPKQFSKYLENHTMPDGSNIGVALFELFEVLNTPVRLRKNTPNDPLSAFAYVNGGLFAEKIKEPPAIHGIRNALIMCGEMFDWSKISPEIFGSLFQASLEDVERKSLGAHFTSETNIKRVLDPLFLSDIRLEFKNARKDRKKLELFRQRIGKLRFLDPACGCGNFLVVTYRELRMLDLETVLLLQGNQSVLDVSMLENVLLENFHGIEIKPVSALIAQVALWLTKHQCNRKLNAAFSTHIKSIPIDETPKIIVGNALAKDWNTLLPVPDAKMVAQGKSNDFDFIIGNPPFYGAKVMSEEQRGEIKMLFKNEAGSGTLDYVTGWYMKAAQYLDISPKTLVAFVSTNSISQGEQVGMLWGTMLEKYGIKIRFAHQTFKWYNDAPGVAAVFCIIVGFGKQKPTNCQLYEYADIKGEPLETKVKNINPYLVEAGDVVIRSRQKPISNVPEIGIGNQPIDGGYYLFTTEEKADFIKKEPFAALYFKRWIGSDEFINGWERWVLWLGETDLETLKKIPLIWKRVELVKIKRLESVRPATKKLAEKPTRFLVENQPKTDYLVIPETSSERRVYIPFGYEKPTTFASNAVKILPNASIFLFGVLISEMHMAWVRYVCGRLKSDYRYSKDIVYNNFPFPTDAPKEAKQAVEKAAQFVLDTRGIYQKKGKNLAFLYDPAKMPDDLLAAHKALDKAVDGSYGLKTIFQSEAKRVAWLFERYEELANK